MPSNSKSLVTSGRSVRQFPSHSNPVRLKPGAAAHFERDAVAELVAGEHRQGQCEPVNACALLDGGGLANVDH